MKKLFRISKSKNPTGDWSGGFGSGKSPLAFVTATDKGEAWDKYCAVRGVSKSSAMNYEVDEVRDMKEYEKFKTLSKVKAEPGKYIIEGKVMPKFGLSSRKQLLKEAENELSKIRASVRGNTNVKPLTEGAWKLTGEDSSDEGDFSRKRFEYTRDPQTIIKNSWVASALKYIFGKTDGIKPSDVPRATRITATVIREYDTYNVKESRFKIVIRFNTAIVQSSNAGERMQWTDAILVKGDMNNPSDFKVELTYHSSTPSSVKSKLQNWLNTPAGKTEIDKLVNKLVDEFKRDTELHTRVR